MSSTRGKQGLRGDRGAKGDTGLRGDKGYSDTNEVVSYLKDIKDIQGKTTDILNNHTTDLAVIKEQVKITNGTVKKNCGDIDSLYKLNNEDDKKWAGLQGSLNAWKYLSAVLSIMLMVLGIFAYVKP